MGVAHRGSYGERALTAHLATSGRSQETAGHEPAQVARDGAGVRRQHGPTGRGPLRLRRAECLLYSFQHFRVTLKGHEDQHSAMPETPEDSRAPRTPACPAALLRTGGPVPPTAETLRGQRPSTWPLGRQEWTHELTCHLLHWPAGRERPPGDASPRTVALTSEEHQAPSSWAELRQWLPGSVHVERARAVGRHLAPGLGLRPALPRGHCGHVTQLTEPQVYLL